MDTNVWIAALKSRRGASHLFLSLIDEGHFEIAVSVPLVIEYEDVALRLIEGMPSLDAQDITDVLDYVCKVAHHQQIFYLWRPYLRDPRDDMVLELAVASQSDAIVTYNLRDFVGIDQFGLKAVTPKIFLEQVGVL